METHNGSLWFLVNCSASPDIAVLGYGDVRNHLGQLFRFSDLSLKPYEKSESAFYSEGDQCSYLSSYRGRWSVYRNVW